MDTHKCFFKRLQNIGLVSDESGQDCRSPRDLRSDPCVLRLLSRLIHNADSAGFGYRTSLARKTSADVLAEALQCHSAVSQHRYRVDGAVESAREGVGPDLHPGRGFEIFRDPPRCRRHLG